MEGSTSAAAELPRSGSSHLPVTVSGGGGYFQMPLHYPKYTSEDYKSMPEWKLDRLLLEYGLPIIGAADQKRKFAMGAFLWPLHAYNEFVLINGIRILFRGFCACVDCLI